ncbi:MAG TPA: hypothetical protein VKZ91_13110 [Woeseiaceae bacterium]|nr:hypothetical protein [Woeseiaceae bacterium]
MRNVILSLIVLCCACAWQTSAAQHDDRKRFAAVDIYLDSGEPVAAWQFEFSSRNGRMKIVGLENGESKAFGGTPYYDREAVQRGTADRIIVADFTLAGANELPSGRIRIATLHLMLTGADAPQFDLELVTAVTHEGRTIDASISLESQIVRKR